MQGVGYGVSWRGECFFWIFLGRGVMYLCTSHSIYVVKCCGGVGGVMWSWVGCYGGTCSIAIALKGSDCGHVSSIVDHLFRIPCFVFVG